MSRSTAKCPCPDNKSRQSKGKKRGKVRVRLTHFTRAPAFGQKLLGNSIDSNQLRTKGATKKKNCSTTNNILHEC